MRYNPLRITNRWYKQAILLLASTVLVACGGSDNGASESLGQDTFDFKPKSTAVALTAMQTAAITDVVPIMAPDGAATGDISVSYNGDMTDIALGTTLIIPQDEAKGFPLGYTGKVVERVSSNGKTTVQLAPATLTDVYETLNLNYDSSRNGMRVVGVLGTNGTFSQTPGSKVTQTGLSLPGLDLGAVFDKSGTKFNVEVPYEVPLSSELDAPKMSITLEANDLQIKQTTRVETVKVPPDPSCLVGGTGCTEQMQKGYSLPGVTANSVSVTGLMKINFSLTSDKTVKTLDKAKAYKIIAKTFRGYNNIDWDKLERNFAGFKFSGLDEKDKEGLIPLGGLVLAPGTAQTFVGDNIKGFEALKNLSVVLWFYIGLNGEIKVAGSLDLISAEIPVDINFGYNDPSASGTAEDTPGYAKKEITVKSKVNAAAEATGFFSLTAAVDAFVGGIRPVSVKFTALEWTPQLSLSAESADIQYYPVVGRPFSGALCYNLTHSLVSGRTTVLADIEVGKKTRSNRWKSVNKDGSNKATFEAAVQGEFGGYDWFAKRFLNTGEEPKKQPIGDPACLSLNPQDLLVEASYDKPAANADYKYYIIDIGRSGAFVKNNVDSLEIRDSWPEGDDTITVPIEAGTTIGAIKLYAGAVHALTISPKSKKYGNLSTIAPILIKVDVPKDFGVSLKPVNDDLSDCKKVQLTAAVVDAPVNASPLSFIWKVAQDNSVVLSNQITSVAFLNTTLPTCNTTTALLNISGKDGSTASTQVTFNPNDLIPLITGFGPAAAMVNETKTFTVTGARLPSTAVMSINDATCGNQVVAADGSQLKATCTMGATTGSKAVTIKTNTQANGGKVIGMVAVTIPTVTSITGPPTLTVDVNATFSINGANLPTADLVITPDGVGGCTRFGYGLRNIDAHTFACTPSATGSLSFTVATVSGQLLGTFPSTPFTVKGAEYVTDQFSESFGGVSLDSNKWSYSGSNSVSNDFLTMGAFGETSTQKKVTFLGNQITIEARIASTPTSSCMGNRIQCSGAFTVSLIDADVPSNSIQFYETPYLPGGFYGGSSGIYAVPEFYLGYPKPTGTWMEYRLNIVGNQLTIERGISLSNISQTNTVTLPAYVTGKKFYIKITTGDTYYGGVNFDWIGVSTAP